MTSGPRANGSGVLLVGNAAGNNGRNPNVGDELAFQLSDLGWRVLVTSSRRSRVGRIVDSIGTAWFQRRNYEVAQVDVFTGKAFAWSEAVAWTMKRAGKPYVLTLHGGNLQAFARRWPGRVRRLLASADAVTAPSRFLQEVGRPYRNDVRIIPNAIDVPRYRFRLRARPTPRIGWLRAFHSIYNPTLAVDVVAGLAREFPNVRLTMAGPDKKDGSKEAAFGTVERLGARGRVDLQERVAKSSVPEWLDRHDLFLNTTNIDNVPISVLEAMASGLCIVSTNVGGIPYLLENESDALLVPPNDPRAMTDAVRRLLCDPDLGERLSHNARAKAERFDWSVIRNQWDQLLKAVASGDRG